MTEADGPVDAETLLRRAQRERRAREHAEALLEEKSRALYDANERLRLAARGRLESLSRLGEDLSAIHDLDLLLNRVLAEARALTSAEAGSVYVREGDRLHCAYSQNDRLDPGRSDVIARLGPAPFVPVSMRSIAGAVAATGIPSNVADAYELPPSAPFRFDHTFDETTGYRTRAVLTLPLKSSSEDVMGVLQLINPVPGPAHPMASFGEDDELLMRHFAALASIAMERARLTRSIVMRMIRSVELRDPFETAEHASRVAALSVTLWEAWARANDVPHDEIERGSDRLHIAAMLHDVGKLGVSDTILRKPGALTDGEMAEVRRHVLLGARLFETVQTEFDRHARDVALYHHARWDGTGYPSMSAVDALRSECPDAAGPSLVPAGSAIPLFARIVAIADVFDALISKRCYKDAWTIPAALEAIREGAGSQFDPDLCALFPAVVERLGARLSIPDAA